MRVVSDTSTLSNLAVIERLDLLRERFGRVLVPPAVQAELSAFTHPAARRGLDLAFQAGWLAAKALSDRRLSTLLTRELDPGESEAIALASEIGADLLLMDESEGRAAAARLGLAITGVLGILLRAKLEGRLSSVRAEVNHLRDEAHFFIAPTLEAQILVAARE